MIHLLALRSIETLEQGGDEAFLSGEIGLKRGGSRDEFFDLLLRSFDSYI